MLKNVKIVIKKVIITMLIGGVILPIQAALPGPVIFGFGENEVIGYWPEKNPDDALLHACFMRDPESARYYLEQGANPNFCAEWASNRTPLMVAACVGSKTLVRMLFEAGALSSINAQKKRGTTALMFAAQLGSLSMVDLLLRAGADYNKLNDDEVNALVSTFTIHFKEKRYAIAKKFLSLGLGKHEKSLNWALIGAVSQKRPQVVDRSFETKSVALLLKHGANPNYKDDAGNFNYPLWYPIVEGNADAVALLVKYGVDKNACDPATGLALLHAAVSNSNKCAEQYRDILVAPIVIHGVNVVDYLERACRSFERIITLLLEGRNPVDIEGNPLINSLLLAGNYEEAQKLVARGINLNQRTTSGKTPLMVAAERGDLAAVQLLVEKSALIYALDASTKMFSAVDLAARRNHKEVVDYLLSKGARFGQWEHKPA